MQNKNLFLAIVLGAILLAIFAVFIPSEKFEAKVTTPNSTVGQVFMQPQDQQILQAGLVEINTQSLSCLSSPRFYYIKLLAQCTLTHENAAETLSKSLKASIVKLTNDLTTISYVAKGWELTRVYLQQVVNQLSQTQEIVAEAKKTSDASAISFAKSSITRDGKISTRFE